MLINKKFNEIEYTLVDCYNWNNNKHIYHFAGDESDLFCKKDENKYVMIKNENTINDIMEYYKLKKPEIYFVLGLPPEILRITGIKNIKRLSDENRGNVIKETVDKLLELKIDISRDELIGRLNGAKICSGKWDSLMHGFFHPGTNTVFLSEVSGLEDGKRTRLHEMIHAISGVGFNFYTGLTNRTGFLEGATENIVEKLYGNKTSSGKIFMRIGAGVGYIHHNFSKDAAYPEQVSLIRQMEYVTQTECDSSILKGNMRFFNDFAQKYGKDTLRFLRHRSNRLLTRQNITDYVQYFNDTQNTLLEIVFNKDLAGIEGLEDAQLYFKRLQGFELVRGDVEGDTSFKDFYEAKLQTVKDNLIGKGFSQESIQIALEQFLYKKSQFLPRETEEEKKNFIQNIIKKQIAKEIEGSEDKEDKIEGIQCFVAKKEDGEHLILTRSGKPIFMHSRTINKYGAICEQVFEFKNKIPEGFTFSQEDEALYLTSPDGNKILLEELQITQYLEQPQEIIQPAQVPTEEQKEDAQTTVSQLSAIKKIANTQPLSKVNKMVNKLKERIRASKDQAKEGEDYGRD